MKPCAVNDMILKKKISDRAHFKFKPPTHRLKTPWASRDLDCMGVPSFAGHY